MATLNIKRFPDALYEKLRARAEQEHRSVSQEVIHLLSRTVDKDEPLSILELRGLGKEVWAGVDPAAHVEQERRSWD
ncbi:MAG: Arc family DNA-binding protein [bacterium]|nr:Arc family DNA-binding protein [bacterium]